LGDVQTAVNTEMIHRDVQSLKSQHKLFMSTATDEMFSTD